MGPMSKWKICFIGQQHRDPTITDVPTVGYRNLHLEMTEYQLTITDDRTISFFQYLLASQMLRAPSRMI